jgi:hypothetical protein
MPDSVQTDNEMGLPLVSLINKLLELFCGLKFKFKFS